MGQTVGGGGTGWEIMKGSAKEHLCVMPGQGQPVGLTKGGEEVELGGAGQREKERGQL